MKKKFRVNGWLPGEEEVVLGYVDLNDYIGVVQIENEYKEVFGDAISFRVREVTMLPYEKGITIITLLTALTGKPRSNFNSMFDPTPAKLKKEYPSQTTV